MHKKIEQFAKLMENELQANSQKGDWETFTDLPAIWNELNYHEAKLYEAYVMGDKNLIREHIADCANILMFMANAYSLLNGGEDVFVKPVLVVQLPVGLGPMGITSIKHSDAVRALEHDFYVLILAGEANVNVLGRRINTTCITKVQYDEFLGFVEAYYGIK